MAVVGYRLSPQQRHVCAIGEDATPVCLSLRLPPHVDLAALRCRVHGFLARHEVFATRFCFPDGVTLPLQVPGDQPELHWSLAETLDGAPIVSTWATGASPGLELPAGLHGLGWRAQDRSVLLRLSCSPLRADITSLLAVAAEIGDAAGDPSTMPAEATSDALSYLQYAEWQNQLLSSQNDELWQSEADAACPPLPFRHDVQGSPDEASGSAAIDLDAALAAALASMAVASGQELRTLILAAWVAVLSRLTGEPAVLIGVRVDGRRLEELRDLPGPLEKDVPLLCRVASDGRLGQFLAHVEQVWQEAADRQDAFDPLWWQRLSPGAAGSPAPSIGFSYWTLPSRSPAAVVVERIDSGLHGCGVRLVCLEQSGRLTARVDYDTQRFTAAKANRLAASLQAWLRALVQAPLDHNLPWPDAVAYGDAIGSGSSATTGCILDAFERQARRQGDRIAVSGGGQQITYRELRCRALSLASVLRAAGVGPEDRVAVFMRRSPELVTALLATLYAGGAFVPLDPANPARRTGLILEDARPAVLLTHSAARGQLPSVATRVIDVDNTGRATDLDATGSIVAARSVRAASAPGPIAPESIVPGSIAYVIFTSGSTGRPKGTMVSHAALAWYIGWAATCYGAEGGGSLLHSSIAFDLGLTTLFGPLAAGTCVYLAPEGDGIAPLTGGLPHTPPLSFLKLTPGHLKLLAARSATAMPPLPPCLVVGGEQLHGNDLEACFAAIPRLRVVNEYGPTEATVGCMTYEVNKANVAATDVPIGRPAPGSDIHILDAAMRRVTCGVPGELYIGGEQLARGYLGRPALTAACFVPDPFAARPGSRLYRTADLACWQSSGELRFLGRADRCLKVRGYRVELDEIEAVLREHPLVSDARVIATSGEAPRIAAYFIARAEGAERHGDSEAAVRHFLADALPDYMLPAELRRLAAWPLTANGKLDTDALPGGHAGTNAAAAGATGGSAEEQILAGVWARVLGRSDIGVDDNYFALGGDSIRSIQIVAQARERGLSLGVEDLFDHQTIRQQAHVAAERRSEPVPPVDRFALLAGTDRDRLPSGLEDAYPLTALQKGMLFHREYSPASAVYHDIFSFRLAVSFDEVMFRATIAGLVARHPVLRTSFDLTRYSEPLQLVHQHCELPLEVADLRELSAEHQARAVNELIAREKARSFEIEAPPLIRFHVDLRTATEIQFTISFHHAIIDGWSDATLLAELFHDYLSALRGVRLSSVAPVARFSDFVALERACVDSPEAAAYWDRRLDGGRSVKLPAPARHSGAARGVRSVEASIPTELSDRLKAVALRLAVPVKHVLLAAHMKVMGLLSGSRDVLSCVVTSGRPERPDGERALGLFINSLPLRLRLPAGSWERLILALFADEQESFRYRRYPLSEIRRRHNLAQLSETLFYFTHYHVYRSTELLAGIACLEYLPHEETSFALTANFGIDPDSSDVFLILAVDQARLGTEAEAAVLQSYMQALEHLAADPTAPHDDAQLLSEDIREKLATVWQGPSVKLPEDRCLRHLLEAQARRSPDAIACTQDGVALSYAELHRRSEALANRLADAGAGPDTLVGICMRRSPDLVIGLVAIVKSGAAFLPLDTAAPPPYLMRLLSDSGAKVIVADDAAAGVAAAYPEVTVLRVSDDTALVSRTHREASGDLALVYALYTSGSTGAPKAVGNTHRGLINRLQWMQAAYPLTPADRVLQKTPCTFDVSVWEFFWPLLTGAAMVLAQPDGHRDPTYLAQLIERERISTLHLVPPMLRAFLDANRERCCPSLRRLVCSGEILPGDLADRFLRQFDAELHNLYGPTEAAIDVTAWPCAPTGDSGPAPIGLPIHNTSIHLLDAELRPVPVGVVGELYIGGVNLARGYLNRPGLTAAKYLPDPFARTGGERLYATGDLAYRRDGGEIVVIGRSDRQIKRNGVRIELAEIEATLNLHPGISQAFVTLEDGAGSGPALTAYLLATDPSPLSYTDLRGFVAVRLPDAFVPDRYIRIDDAPLTPNGKLDRAALAGAHRTPLQPTASASSFRLPEEAMVAEVWADVLGQRRFGAHDRFFAVGGDSLRAMQVVARLDRIFRVRLSLKAFMAEPTVAALARHVAAWRGRDDVMQLPATAGQTEWHLSSAQKGLVFLAGSQPVGAAYNVPGVIRLTGPLDEARLRRSFELVVERHEVLRAAFVTSGEQPMMRLGAAEFRLERCDLRDMSPGERIARTRDIVRDVITADFDLQRGPLLRGALIVEGPQQHLLALSVHHAVCDGWSMRILLADLARYYAAVADAAASRQDRDDVASRPYQDDVASRPYRDYVAFERSTSGAALFARQLVYWRKRLASLPRRSPLAALAQGSAPVGYAGRLESVLVPEELTSGLRAVARGHDATLFVVLLGAFKMLLASIASRDIVVGTDVAGRTWAATESMVGLLANQLTLRTDLAGRLTARDVLDRVKQTVLAAYEHAEVPFELVARQCGQHRKLSAPLFDVKFVLDAKVAAPNLAGLAATIEDYDTGSAKFDCLFNLADDGACITGTMQDKTELFGSDIAQKLIEEFLFVLGEIVETPALQLDHLIATLSDMRQARSRRARQHEAIFSRNALLRQLDVIDRQPATGEPHVGTP